MPQSSTLRYSVLEVHQIDHKWVVDDECTECNSALVSFTLRCSATLHCRLLNKFFSCRHPFIYRCPNVFQSTCHSSCVLPTPYCQQWSYTGSGTWSIQKRSRVQVHDDFVHRLSRKRVTRTDAETYWLHRVRAPAQEYCRIFRFLNEGPPHMLGVSCMSVPCGQPSLILGHGMPVLAGGLGVQFQLKGCLQPPPVRPRGVRSLTSRHS